MLLRIKARQRESPSSTEHLKQMLIDRHKSISAAARHYQLPRQTLDNIWSAGTVSQSVERVLGKDYDLRQLATECECGELYFPPHGFRECPSCAERRSLE